MSKIYLVRHGQDKDNEAKILNGRRDMELTDLGRAQAKQVAEKLRDKNIQIVYASPLKRAYETARIIAEELGIDEIVADEHLMEREFGILTGRPLEDIPKLATEVMHVDGVNYFLEVEGAENFPSLLRRGTKILAEIRSRHPGQDILIVTHGDTGKMIRAAFHGWSWEEGLKTPYFANTGVLELEEKQDIIE